MRYWTVYIWGLLLATTSCEQVGNKMTNTPENDTAIVQTIPYTIVGNSEIVSQSEKHFGTYITHGKRRGGLYTDSTGINYFSCHVTARIINDSTIPMQVKIAFLKEYYQPTPYNGQRFRVFLLSQTMVDQGFDNKEIKNCLDNRLTINETIDPQKGCILNIGFLIETKFGENFFNPIPFELFMKGDRQHFSSIPDSVINNVVSVKNQSPLLLGLVNWHKKDYCVIPCGQISFSN